MNIKTKIRNISPEELLALDFYDQISDHVEIIQEELGELKGKFTITIEYESNV